ncbi:hypothetical protein IFM89_031690 [Coptis chinensis]|uniref:Uncharacterized protein n=1 Tax=Coptis chinensis TaxID=261450 RepID=A0A835LPP1_9MAGN|nr:hypothetical protein IFM89_031690 [Coptis chinensis]
MKSVWKRSELVFLIIYAFAFYAILIRRSLQLSHDYSWTLDGLRAGWISDWPNDVSDSQWRNFRGNLPVLTFVFGIFTIIANTLREMCRFKGRGMSTVWLFISLIYLSYLHGACVLFVLSIASLNFLMIKISAKSKHFPFVLWIFNLFWLLCNRIYEGYSFSTFGQRWAFLDDYRGSFRWHICFNFVTLRMISFGYDYYWAHQNSRFDQKKHIQHCYICSSGKICYNHLQERSVQLHEFSFSTYLCYLVYAPLYIAGPIVSFNAFAAQLDTPQKNHSVRSVAWYGLRWVLSLFLMELMTHLFYYNAFAGSDSWKHLSPFEVFIIGYGVSSLFLCLKLHVAKVLSDLAVLSNLVIGMLKYMYIPLGGSRRKLLNVWVVFTFVAIWHDLEWKLLSWAWLTCLFFIPELLVKSAVTSFKVTNFFAIDLLSVFFVLVVEGGCVMFFMLLRKVKFSHA